MRFGADGCRSALLASCSGIALLIGGGAPAWAACTQVTSNSNYNNVSGICVTNTSFTGSINVQGTISPSGIQLTNGTISGQIFAGYGVVNGGISLDSNSAIIAGTNTSSALTLQFLDGLSGGISNAGTISAADTAGILISEVGTVSGGITNSGTISGADYGIRISSVPQFGDTSAGGGITNSGTISGGVYGGVSLSNVTNFSGGITNGASATISSRGGGIQIGGSTASQGVGVFSGGVSNAGIISAGGDGVYVGSVSSFSGGISNTGTISAGGTGVIVFSIGAFSGGISNSGTITAGGIGIRVSTVSQFGGTSAGGGITNSGAISAGNDGIFIGRGDFSGGIANSGSISAVNAGIELYTTPTFTGNISNSGTITAATGIAVVGSTITGSILDSGSILASSRGISIDGASRINSTNTAIKITGPTFTGGISNAGTISATAGIGIELSHISSFANTISNSGTISAATGIAIVGSTINGAINDTGTILASNHGILVDSASRITGVTAAIEVAGPTFTGGISNAGTLSATYYGIAVSDVTQFGAGSAGGGVTNSGTISARSGIVINGGGTFAAAISNTGTITHGASAGYGVVVTKVAQFGTGSIGGGVSNSGVITDSEDIVVSSVSTFTGGITNSGSLNASGDAIAVFGADIGGVPTAGISTFSGGVVNKTGGVIVANGAGIYVTGALSFGSSAGGGVTNAGTISVGGTGIYIYGVTTFAGGISNSGTITGAGGIRVNTMAETTSIATFLGGISNSGLISAGYTGISVYNVSTFSGGVTNSGTISAIQGGIAVNQVTSFAGGVSNSGAITAGYSGISIGLVTSFLGGVTNSGTISAGLSGIAVASISTFSGGISNSGLISATRAGIGINDSGGTSFLGGVTNSGTILAGGNGLAIGGMSYFGGGAISNSGTISAAVSGIGVVAVTTFASSIANSGMIQGSRGVLVESVASFLGSISNSGTISAGYLGVYLQDVSTFTGNLSNSGTISAPYGVAISSGVTFGADSAIINSGTIIGTTSAIDVANATSPVTIDQTGGLISGSIKLSANADVLNISGGTISGDIVGQGAQDTINFAPGATFTYGAAYGFSGLNQVNVNSGNVILDGANSATNVRISAGTLEVGDVANPGATLTVANPIEVYGTLAGHGAVDGDVDIEAGGTLSPGGSIGTLTINGNLAFSSSNAYAFEISPTQTSTTQVNGAVTLGGATVVVTPGLGSSGARTYTILTDTLGGLGGANTFDPTVSVTKSGVLLDPTLTYDADDVYLSIQGYTDTLVLASNATLNAQNVAGAINRAILGGGALPTGFQTLATLSGAGLNDAVNRLGGQVQGSFAPVGFEAGDLFLNLMLNPHVEGREGTAALGSASAYAEDPATASPALAALTPPARSGFTPQMALWGAAYGAGGTFSGDASGAAGVQSSIYGVAAGLDDHFTPNAMVGFALAGGGTGGSLGQAAGSASSQMFQAGVYGTTQSGPSYLSGALAYSWHDVTTKRTSSLAGFGTLKGEFDANVLSSRLEAGYHLLQRGGLTVTPYAAGEAQIMVLPSFAEAPVSAAAPFALDYSSRTYDALRLEFGGRFDADWSLAGNPLKLYSRLAWAHDFDDEGVEGATFLSLPGASFVVNTVKPAHDSALASVGFDYGLLEGWSVGGKFDGEFSRTTEIYSATGEIKKIW